MLRHPALKFRAVIFYLSLFVLSTGAGQAHISEPECLNESVLSGGLQGEIILRKISHLLKSLKAACLFNFVFLLRVVENVKPTMCTSSFSAANNE